MVTWVQSPENMARAAELLELRDLVESLQVSLYIVCWALCRSLYTLFIGLLAGLFRYCVLGSLQVSLYIVYWSLCRSL